MLATLAEGSIFACQYRIVRCIAAGGMGAVYEVVHVATERHRALKVVLPQFLASGGADAGDRFLREARVTARVESDFLVDVVDVGVDAATELPFLVMELLRGEEIGKRLARVGRLPAAEVVTLLYQTALALAKTHASGIVHCDLKPENLFLTHRDDGAPCVKILDFGIAKVVAQLKNTRMTGAAGSPLYMAPEQIRGTPAMGPATDIYALGHIAYALLAGEPYWTSEAEVEDTLLALLAKIIEGAAEPATARARRRRGVTLPAAFDAWFARTTALAPNRRFEHATNAVTALAWALELPQRGAFRVAPEALPPAIGPARPPEARRPAVRARRFPLVGPLSLVLAAAVSAGAFLALSRARGDEPEGAFSSQGAGSGGASARAAVPSVRPAASGRAQR